MAILKKKITASPYVPQRHGSRAVDLFSGNSVIIKFDQGYQGSCSLEAGGMWWVGVLNYSVLF